MANIKIAQLTNKTSLADTDLLIVESATQTMKMTVSNLKSQLGVAWESFESLPLENGWTGILQVRRNGLGMVHIKGEIIPGTTTRGTTITTIPTKYRPTYVTSILAQSLNTATGMIRGLGITTAGNLNIYADADDNIGTGSVRINFVFLAD